MFCALNGATDTPRRLSHAQMAVVIQLLPAFEDVPPTNSDRAVIVTTAERSCPGAVHAISRISRTAWPGPAPPVGRRSRASRRRASSDCPSHRLVFLRVDDEGRAVQRSRRDERIGPRVVASERHVGMSVRDQDRDRVIGDVARRQLERVSERRSAACRQVFERAIRVLARRGRLDEHLRLGPAARDDHDLVMTAVRGREKPAHRALHQAHALVNGVRAAGIDDEDEARRRAGRSDAFVEILCRESWRSRVSDRVEKRWPDVQLARAFRSDG